MTIDTTMSPNGHEMQQFVELITEVLRQKGIFVRYIVEPNEKNIEVVRVENPTTTEGMIAQDLLDSFEKAKKHIGDFRARALEAWYENVPMFQMLREVDHKALETMFINYLDTWYPSIEPLREGDQATIPTSSEVSKRRMN